MYQNFIPLYGKIFHCMYLSLFIYSFTNGHLSCFHLLASVNNVQWPSAYKCLSSPLSTPLGTYLRVKLLGNKVILCLVFSSLRNCQTVFYNTVPFYVPTAMYEVPVLPHLHQHLLFSFFFIIEAILVGVKGYLVVVLICISLITNDVEHHFICLLAIYLSLEKCLLKSCTFF